MGWREELGDKVRRAGGSGGGVGGRGDWSERNQAEERPRVLELGVRPREWRRRGPNEKWRRRGSGRGRARRQGPGKLGGPRARVRGASGRCRGRSGPGAAALSEAHGDCVL